MPLTPEVPLDPELPFPELPEVPELPLPLVPEVPDVPELPWPEEPLVPELPLLEVPDEPELPKKVPLTPEVPELPETPATPAGADRSKFTIIGWAISKVILITSSLPIVTFISSLIGPILLSGSCGPGSFGYIILKVELALHNGVGVIRGCADSNIEVVYLGLKIYRVCWSKRYGGRPGSSRRGIGKGGDDLLQGSLGIREIHVGFQGEKDYPVFQAIRGSVSLIEHKVVSLRVSLS